LSPQRRKPQAALGAGFLDGMDVALRVMNVMARVGAFVGVRVLGHLGYA
jgi:hypothetical protein